MSIFTCGSFSVDRNVSSGSVNKALTILEVLINGQLKISSLKEYNNFNSDEQMFYHRFINLPSDFFASRHKFMVDPKNTSQCTQGKIG